MKNEDKKPDLTIVRIAVIGVCESFLDECNDLIQEMDELRDERITKKNKLKKTVKRFQSLCLHSEIKQAKVHYNDCRYPIVGRICVFCGCLEEIYNWNDRGIGGTFKILHGGQGQKLEILGKQGVYRAWNYDEDFTRFGLVANKEWREVLIRTRKLL